MNIRFLNQADVDSFWEVRLRALKDEIEVFGADYETESLKPQAEKIAQFQNNISNDNAILGAFEGNKLVGMMGLRRRNPGIKTQHRATIWGVYVLPEARGQGVSRKMLLTLIERVKTIAGLELLDLTVVTTNNIAKRLYLSFGFKIYGTDPHAIKVNGQYLDEDLMYLLLTKDEA